jgi:hypothetical protein
MYGFAEDREQGLNVDGVPIHPAEVPPIESHVTSWLVLEPDERTSITETYALLEAMDYRFHVLFIPNIGRHS